MPVSGAPHSICKSGRDREWTNRGAAATGAEDRGGGVDLGVGLTSRTAEGSLPGTGAAGVTFRGRRARITAGAALVGTAKAPPSPRIETDKRKRV